MSPIGAELQHLTTPDGKELQWDGDPAVWAGRAPILFPIIGKLTGDAYRLAGKTYAMPKHGFARHSLFDVIDAHEDTAAFRLSASNETRALYPFEFVLELRYAVAGASLAIAATITNEGTSPMPASFGFHPALRWPLPFDQPRSAHRIGFAQTESVPLRRIDADGYLLPQPFPSPISGDTLILRDALFVDDALIFEGLASRHVVYGAKQGPHLAVEFCDFPTLGVWTKPGAGYICIEPWQGVADPVGYTGDIFDKPGIFTLTPGASRKLAMSLSLHE